MALLPDVDDIPFLNPYYESRFFAYEEDGNGLNAEVFGEGMVTADYDDVVYSLDAGSGGGAIDGGSGGDGLDHDKGKNKNYYYYSNFIEIYQSIND